jgi:hypothetical protein
LAGKFATAASALSSNNMPRPRCSSERCCSRFGTRTAESRDGVAVDGGIGLVRWLGGDEQAGWAGFVRVAVGCFEGEDAVGVAGNSPRI